VRNPFRDEASAFRLLLLTVGAFALIALGSWINTWLGLAVFLVETVVAVGWYLHARGERPPPVRVEHRGGAGERRILVIANETVAGDELMELVRSRAEGVRAEVLVVCPALNSPLKHWVSDEDAARAAAQERLQESLGRLAALGIEAHGEVGDSDPVQAADDALRVFGADEIVVSTHPEGRSNWLERGVVQAVRERFDVPVRHVIVDLEAGAARRASAARDE
jgi:hypothetical protein